MTAAALEEARRRFREDYTFYPERCLKIVTKGGDLVAFRLKRPQERLARGLMAQREAGAPQRAIILKSRQVGFSTLAQGLMIQRATQTPNHHALIVAQDTKTVGSIFRMGRRMWRHLPADVKPPLVGDRNGRGEAFMHFGEPSRMLRSQGLAGLDSLIEVGSAREVDAGRGITPHSLHLSEVAFWRSSEKMLALKNAVPEVPGSLILEESTANGHNWFREDWHAAVAGESGYLAIFTPWFEEDEYRIRFPDAQALESFAASVGHGKYGEDEPELMRLIPERIREWEAEWGDEPLTDEQLRVRVLEHLAWRRRTIAARCEGDVAKFHQEYPSTPDEAFLSTGRRIFPAKHVGAILKRCEVTDPVVPSLERPGPVRGGFVATKTRMVRVAHGGTLDLPTEVRWVPARELEDAPAPWKLWQLPDPGDEDVLPKRPPGRYIAGVDVMSGEEDEEGTLARHAVEIIDHRTLKQVAEYDSQDDADTLALECLKAALFFHHAIVAVEITGGWGIPVVNRLARSYRYPRVFRRSPADHRMVDPSQRLGWSTDVATKPLMEARGVELVREGMDGIVSRELAAQMLTYVRNARGKSKPEPGKLSDRLMAWLIAQTVATISPVPTRDIHGSSSTGGGTVRTTVSA